MSSAALPSTQKALVVPSQGAPAELRSDIPLPKPSPTQLLVKVIYAAINPVDVFTTQFGLLVESWPFVPGSEASGVVVKAGSDAISPLGDHFKEGDLISGCVRLGVAGHGTFAEYFLLDAEVAMPKPKDLSLASAATVAVGSLTAFLGIFGELGISIEGIEEGKGDGNGRWVVVFGGAGAVGRFAVQTFKLAGYKVIATSSTQSFDVSPIKVLPLSAEMMCALTQCKSAVGQIARRRCERRLQASCRGNHRTSQADHRRPNRPGFRCCIS